MGGGGRQGCDDRWRPVRCRAPVHMAVRIAALLCCDVVWCGLSGGSSQWGHPVSVVWDGLPLPAF